MTRGDPREVASSGVALNSRQPNSATNDAITVVIVVVMPMMPIRLSNNIGNQDSSRRNTACSRLEHQVQKSPALQPWLDSVPRQKDRAPREVVTDTFSHFNTSPELEAPLVPRVFCLGALSFCRLAPRLQKPQPANLPEELGLNVARLDFYRITCNAAESSIRHRTTARKRKLVGLILPFTLLASQALAATYPVINLNDSGPGSLREAILSANASKGSTVAFGTSGTINLSTPLPDIASQMTIDGTTAPGFSVTRVPVVSVNFNSIPGLTVGRRCRWLPSSNRFPSSVLSMPLSRCRPRKSPSRGIT